MSRVARLLGPLAAFGALAAAIVVTPAFLSDFQAQQAAYVGIYTIALLGLNVLTGYAGQISLGHGAFMAVGGYTSAILIADHGVKDLWTIPVAVAVAGAAGFLFGVPALRLSGLYLALATFAIAVATPALIKRFEGFTGGGSGKNLFGRPELTGSLRPVHVLGYELTFNNWLYYLAWTAAFVAYVIAWLFLRGRVGRALRALRDSETAAVSSGISLARYKTLAFGVSAAYAGLAGSLYAIGNTYVNPDTFPISLSIFLLVGVVLGGLGSLLGVMAGAVFIYFMPLTWAQSIDSAIPDWLPLLGNVSTKTPGAPAVVFGVVLITLMLALPGGASGLLARVLGPLTSRRYDRPSGSRD